MNKLRLTTLLTTLSHWFKRRIAIVVNCIALIVLLWLGTVIYQNVYQTTISPEPIDQSEIIARRKKIQTSQFETALERIKIKEQSTPVSEIESSPDPFN